MKDKFYNLDKSYIIRQSPFVLMGKLLLLELATGLTTYILGLEILGDYYTLFLLIIKLIKVPILIALVLRWHYHFYIISESVISVNYGVLSKRTKSIDVASIQSIKIKQSLMGRLLNYGTLVFESPFVRKDVYLRSIENVEKNATNIDKARVAQLQEKPISDVTPVI